jgi:TRAP-type C4-dicarboxylate transport system permease small subunit
MLRLFAAIDALLATILRWVMIVMMAMMTTAVFAQVFFRYLLNVPLGWSEELSRFAFVWLCFLGAAYLVRAQQHLRVTIIESNVPRGARAALRVVQYVGALFCAVVFLRGGIGIVGDEWGQVSPATGLRMGYVYGVIPVAAALMVLWIIASGIAEIRRGLKPDAPHASRSADDPELRS